MHHLTQLDWQGFRWTRAQVLLLTSGFALALLAFRTLWTSQTIFWFLGWNLFLAWVPWLIAQLSTWHRLRTWMRLPLLGGWVLFLPNAPYILTDLFHLRERTGVPIWFDLLLILTFAWAGMMWGFASLRKIESQILRRWFGRLTPLISGGLLVLSAYGVYLGRYLRFNSWDLFTHPQRIYYEILEVLIHPLSNGPAVGFSVGFGCFLMVAYALYVGTEEKLPTP